MNPPCWCILCNGCLESADHIPPHCRVARRLWTALWSEFEIDWIMPQCSKQVLAEIPISLGRIKMAKLCGTMHLLH